MFLISLFFIYRDSDRNRALPGDIVVVEELGELLPKDFEKYKSGSDILKIRKPDIGPSTSAAREEAPSPILEPTSATPVPEGDDDVDSDLELDDDEVSTPRKIARIVCVLERRPGQTYSGFLMPAGWRPGMRIEEFEDVAVHI